MLAVKDPDDPGENVSRDELDSAAMGIVRRHIAGLLKPLGHLELAAAIRRLASTENESLTTATRGYALTLLNRTEPRSIDGPAAVSGIDLVGGFVARGGPLGAGVTVDRAKQDLLVDLDLRSTFVGIERASVLAAIEGDLPKISALAKDGAPGSDGLDGVRRDQSSTWVVRLEAEGSRVK